MTLPAKIGASSLAFGGTAAAGYYAVFHYSSEDKSYRGKFLSVSLLNTVSGDDSYWTKRLESLKKDSEASSGLSSIKTKTIEDLRGWCKDSLSRQFEEGKLFKEIDSYCTFKVLDKLGSNAIPETTADGDSKWKTAFDALGKIADHLGEELEGIKKTQDSGSNNATKVAVKGWCKKMYSETYKGDSDKLFEVAKKVCVSA